MTDIIKLDMTKIWAASGDKVQPSDSQIASGWLVQQVARQTWNWFENRQDQNIAYMLQKGIPEWDSTTEYIINKSYVQRGNIIYKAIATTTGVDPTGNPASWVKAFVESSSAGEALKALIPAANALPYFTSTTAAGLTTLTPFARTILDDADAAAVRATISAQLANANLDTLSTVTAGANALPYFTGTNTATTTLLTSFGRSLIDDADAIAARVTLGLGDSAVLNVGTVTGTVAAGDDPRIVGALSRANNLSDLISASAARTNLGLGTSALLNVTTSATDTTANRVLKTGDFGVGGDSIAVSSSIDMNTMTVAGNFAISSFTGSNGPVGTSTPTNMYVRIVTSGTNIKQFVAGRGSAGYFSRYSLDSGATWSAWTENWNTGNTSANVQSILTAADYAAVRSLLGLSNKAQAGANSDITSLSGLTTPLSVGQGGTGVTTSTGTGSVVLSASPTLTGVPLAPTATFGSNSTQIATTAFVQANATAVPTGAVLYSAAPSGTPPVGYVIANGAALSRTTYAALFAAIGTTYGAGDGSTTFNVPDFRGVFLRGLDNSRGLDPSRALGTLQSSQNLSHTHTGTVDAAGTHTHTASSDGQGQHNHSTAAFGFNTGDSPAGQIARIPGAATTVTGDAGYHAHNISVAAVGNHQHTFTTGGNGGTEARPVNYAVNVYIKY